VYTKLVSGTQMEIPVKDCHVWRRVNVIASGNATGQTQCDLGVRGDGSSGAVGMRCGPWSYKEFGLYPNFSHVCA
jgi:hypothetical protein